MRDAAKIFSKAAAGFARLPGTGGWRMRAIAATIACLIFVPGQAAPARNDEPITPLPRLSAKETAQIAFGRRLFFDGRLSRSGKTSCATCHDLATNGATKNAVDRGDGGKPLAFNTPTIFNAGYNYRLNWKGNSKSMSALVAAAFHDQSLMGGEGHVIPKLNLDPQAVASFRNIFGRSPNIADAAAAMTAYLQTLVTPDARFDRWLRGEKTALAPQQRRGYARFKALGCASCHQGVNLGGNLFQKSGVYAPLTKRSPGLLRVPSLRNVAVTAPYFHDGSAATLETAVVRMGRAQLGARLSQSDVADIVAFLEALTGTYQGRRLTAPGPTP